MSLVKKEVFKYVPYSWERNQFDDDDLYDPDHDYYYDDDYGEYYEVEGFEEYSQKTDVKKTHTDHKKQNTIVFIDAENISVNSAGNIIRQGKSVGEVAEVRYYARQKDPCTEAWKDVANLYGIKKHLIYGEPGRNKIDSYIIKDAKNIIDTKKNIDIICIASKDGDFAELVEYLRVRRKRVVILAAEHTSQKLKAAASEVKGI